MEPLTDAEREARVAARVDELWRNVVCKPYWDNQTMLELDERFTFFGGIALRDALSRGDVSVLEVVAAIRAVYVDVRARKKTMTAPALMRYVQALPEAHALGIEPRQVGWMAVRDLLGDEQITQGVKLAYGVPPSIPTVGKPFWRLGNAQGFARVHDPRRVFEVLARMELDAETHDVGRKRRQRAHKGENRRRWNTSAFYSEALLRALHERTGVPVWTLKKLLRDARYEMPLAWTLV